MNQVNGVEFNQEKIEVTKKKAIIFQRLSQMAHIFDLGAGQEKLSIYAEMLVQYDLTAIEEALKTVIANHDSYRFPTLAKILCELNPFGDIDLEAQKMAGNIFEQATRFGHYQIKEIIKELSEDEIKVLEIHGGLNQIFFSTHENYSIIRAQIRDVCKKVLQEKRTSGLNHKLLGSQLPLLEH